MKYAVRYIILALLAFLLSNCFVRRKKGNDIDEKWIKQYAFVSEKSIKFDEANDSFRYLFKSFIDTCTEYNFQYEKRVSPFGNYTPVLLKPYLLNNAEDEIILLVHTRAKDLANATVDYIHFISGKLRAGKWYFTLKERYVHSFGYEGNLPLLNETEISLRMLRRLIYMGYMHPRKLEIKDRFFKMDW